MNVYKPTKEQINETQSWGTWGKEPSTFPLYYEEKETCYILEGEAEVKDNAGNSIIFSIGDMVEFPQGLECKWHIIKTIRKKYLFG